MRTRSAYPLTALALRVAAAILVVYGVMQYTNATPLKQRPATAGEPQAPAQRGLAVCTAGMVLGLAGLWVRQTPKRKGHKGDDFGLTSAPHSHVPAAANTDEGSKHRA